MYHNFEFQHNYWGIAQDKHFSGLSKYYKTPSRTHVRFIEYIYTHKDHLIFTNDSLSTTYKHSSVLLAPKYTHLIIIINEWQVIDFQIKLAKLI